MCSSGRELGSVRFASLEPQRADIILDSTLNRRRLADDAQHCSPNRKEAVMSLFSQGKRIAMAGLMSALVLGSAACLTPAEARGGGGGGHFGGAGGHFG